jgi:alkylated DNA repair dioxygenase AlkB
VTHRPPSPPSLPPDDILDLGDGALLQFWHSPLMLADGLTDVMIRELPWDQPSVTLYGRCHPIPRLQCWFGDPGAEYRYSGHPLHRHAWLPPLQPLREATERVTALPFNSVLVSLYRDGSDSMGWHADDEKELGEAPWIASWSFGATRDFCLRRKGTSRLSHSIPLHHGQLVLMSPEVQKYWQHALPKRRRIGAPRINLTFRQIVPPV